MWMGRVMRMWGVRSGGNGWVGEVMQLIWVRRVVRMEGGGYSDGDNWIDGGEAVDLDGKGSEKGGGVDWLVTG